jgi:hypothetical protein
LEGSGLGSQILIDHTHVPKMDFSKTLPVIRYALVDIR